jgi:hypothetical protein
MAAAFQKMAPAVSRTAIAVMLLALCAARSLSGCGGPAQNDGVVVTQADRMAWSKWSDNYLVAVCAHQDMCGTPAGAACFETGAGAAQAATCDNAVRFYLENRQALDRCVQAYPPSCSVTAKDACPIFEAHGFETLCP